MSAREFYAWLGRSALLAAAMGLTAYLAFGAITGAVPTNPAFVDSDASNAGGGAGGDDLAPSPEVPTHPLAAVTLLAFPAFLLWPIPSRVPRDIGRVVRTGFLFGIGVYSAWYLGGSLAFVEPRDFAAGLALVLAAAVAFPLWMSGSSSRPWASGPGTRAAGAGLLLGVLDGGFAARIQPDLDPGHLIAAVVAALAAFVGLRKAPAFPRDGRYWEALVAGPLGWCVFLVVMVPFDFPELLRGSAAFAFGLPAAVLLGGSLAYYVAELVPDSQGEGDAAGAPSDDDQEGTT